MRIVTNGSEYAICKYWWPFTVYFDLVTPGLWWFPGSQFYTHCWASKEEALLWYYTLKPKKLSSWEY